MLATAGASELAQSGVVRKGAPHTQGSLIASALLLSWRNWVLPDSHVGFSPGYLIGNLTGVLGLEVKWVLVKPVLPGMEETGEPPEQAHLPSIPQVRQVDRFLQL